MHSAVGLVRPSRGEGPGFGMLEASILLQRRVLRLPRWEGPSPTLQFTRGKLGSKDIWDSPKDMRSELGKIRCAQGSLVKAGKGWCSSQQVCPIPPSLPASPTLLQFFLRVFHCSKRSTSLMFPHIKYWPIHSFICHFMTISSSVP